MECMPIMKNGRTVRSLAACRDRKNTAKLTCSATEVDKLHDIAQMHKRKGRYKDSQKCYKT